MHELLADNISMTWPTAASQCPVQGDQSRDGDVMLPIRDLEHRLVDDLVLDVQPFFGVENYAGEVSKTGGQVDGLPPAGPVCECRC